MQIAILLGMAEELADAFQKSLELQAQNLSLPLHVLNKPVVTLHNCKASLQKFKPDILLLSTNSINYDTKDKKNELLSTIFEIRSDPNLNKIRLAIITDLNEKDPFLKKLATLQVADIFLSKGPEGQVNISQIAEQLAKPANLLNISRFLSLEDNHESGFRNENIETKPLETIRGNKFGTYNPTSNFENSYTSYKRLSSVPDIRNNLQSNSGNSRPKELINYRENYRNQSELLKTQNKKEVPKTRKNKEKRTIFELNSVVKVALVVITVLGLLTAAFSVIVSNKGREDSQNTIPSFSALISDGYYDKAAQYYPKRAIESENAMLKSDIKDKAEMADKISQYVTSDVITFDKAYFDEDYQTVVDTYRASTDSNFSKLSKQRRLMLAYSLMKTGDINNAMLIAKPLESSAFNKRIQIFGKFYNANKMLREKIKTGNLSPEEKAKAERQITENQKIMDKM